MGTIRVHEFASLDGVLDAPTWTFDYGFDPTMDRLEAEFEQDGFAVIGGVDLEVADSAGTRELGSSSDEGPVDPVLSPLPQR